MIALVRSPLVKVNVGLLGIVPVYCDCATEFLDQSNVPPFIGVPYRALRVALQERPTESISCDLSRAGPGLLPRMRSAV